MIICFLGFYLQQNVALASKKGTRFKHRAVMHEQGTQISNYGGKKINPLLFKLNWLSANGIVTVRGETRQQAAKATRQPSGQVRP